MYHADGKSKSSSATGAMFLLGMALKGYFGGIKYVWMRSRTMDDLLTIDYSMVC